MRKVIVFDCKNGGSLITDYLSNELGVVDFIKVNDNNHTSYGEFSFSEVYRFISMTLEKYCEKVDLVIIADYLPSLFIKQLEMDYPTQKFIGLSPSFKKFNNTKIPPRKIIILGSQAVLESETLERELDNVNNSEIIKIVSDQWRHLIDDNILTSDFLKENLEIYLDQNLDIIYLADTRLWDIIREFEEIIGWQVRLVDNREDLLYDTCKVLGLLGVDGRRRR